MTMTGVFEPLTQFRGATDGFGVVFRDGKYYAQMHRAPKRDAEASMIIAERGPFLTRALAENACRELEREYRPTDWQ